MMSFSEIIIYNMKNQKMNQIGKVDFDFEPKIISLGPNIIGLVNGL
jgi:hypothetical protein